MKKSETIEVVLELNPICDECDGYLELALQKNRTLYIAPYKNCCKKDEE